MGVRRAKLVKNTNLKERKNPNPTPLICLSKHFNKVTNALLYRFFWL